MHFCLQTAMNKGQFLQHDFVMLKTRTLLLTPQAWKTHRVLWLFVLGRTTVTVACLNFCFRWTWIASFTTRNFNIDGMSFPIWKAIFQNTQVDTSRVIFSEFPIKHHPLRTTISIFLGIVEFTSYIIAYFCSYRTWQPPKNWWRSQVAKQTLLWERAVTQRLRNQLDMAEVWKTGSVRVVEMGWFKKHLGCVF